LVLRNNQVQSTKHQAPSTKTKINDQTSDALNLDSN
jgi:hypothetical protein